MISRNIRYFWILLLIVCSISVICYYKSMDWSTGVLYLPPFTDSIQPDIPFQCRHFTLNELMKPCRNVMAWDKREMNKELRTNALLTEITFKKRPPGMESEIRILTVDKLNRSKSIGGDFWLVNVRGPISFYVPIIDNADGSYVGKFDIMTYGEFEIIIVLEHSFCDGARDPPTWWFLKG